MKFRNLIFATVLFPLSAMAQNFYGLQNSNFNGINGVFTNPGLIADTRWKMHANGTAFGMNMFNNYVTLDLPFSLTDLVKGNIDPQYKNAQGQIKWDPSWFKENLNGKPKNFNFGLEWRGPSAMWQLNKKLSVGVTTRSRFGINLYNISESLVRFAKSAIDSNINLSLLNDNSFAFNASAYQEIGGSIAAVLYNKEAYYVKAGATLKYLQGIGAIYALNENLSVKFQGKDSIYINSSDVRVGHSNPNFLDKLQNGNFLASLPSVSNVNGSGVGLDVGGVFEWRPKITDLLTSGNKYLLRAGFSILDLGAINYKNNVTNYSASNTNPVLFKLNDTNLQNAFAYSVDSGTAWIQSFAKQKLNYKQGPGQFKVNIPTTINIQLDYNLIKTFYLGLNWTQNMIKTKKQAFTRPSSIVVIPRFEHRLIEASLPLSMYNNYSDFGVGGFLRIGPAYIGTDNLFRSIKSSQFNGFDFYFGFSSGIPSKKAKKKD